MKTEHPISQCLSLMTKTILTSMNIMSIYVTLTGLDVQHLKMSVNSIVIRMMMINNAWHVTGIQ